MAFSGTRFEREVSTAVGLARSAGIGVLEHHRSGVEVELKDGKEPVTVADREASELIVAGLCNAFPEDIVISEESEDDLRRLEHERVWFVDPIDGTKDFISGYDGFCVMIGLAVSGVPAVGVVYQPTGGAVFAAATSTGAFTRPAGAGTWLPIHVSEVNEPSSIRLVASKSSRDRRIDEVKSALGIQTELNIGSVGLKIALIAVGERDLYVNPSTRCKTWDTCAPEVLLREAGGRLTDLEGGPLRYTERDQQHRRGLLASNALLHESAVDKLRGIAP